MAKKTIKAVPASDETRTLVLTQELIDGARIASTCLEEVGIQIDSISRLIRMSNEADERADREALIDAAMMMLDAVNTSVGDGCADTPGLWNGVTTVSRAIRKAAGQESASAEGGAA